MANTVETMLAGLPPEYQAEIAKLLRQRALGDTFTQQGLSALNQPTQFTPGPYSYAVPQNPLGSLAHGLAAYLGNRGATQADQGIAGIGQKAAEATAQGISQISGAGPEIRSTMINQGLASTNPQVRAFALQQQKQDQDTATAAAKGLFDYGDPRAALATLRARQINPNYSPTPIPGPQFSSVPGPSGPINYAITTNRKGEQTVHSLGGQQINVDARQQTQELGAGLDVIQAQLKDRQARAQIAKDTLAFNTAALEALNAGAKVGGLGGVKQATRKVAQAFGVDLPETAPTEQLNMALGNAILAKARALAPVTGEDIKQLQAILGSLDTDPTALMKALTVYNGIAAKELQTYNRYVEDASSTLTNPRARDMFAGAKIGYEMPPIPGTTTQQMRTIQEAVRRGANPTQFAVGGQPIEPGAQFDIRGSGIPNAPATPQQLKPVSEMTPEEKQAEIAALKRKLGISP